MARKILLADDSVTAQNMGRKILTDAGYDVVTVNNGSAAMKRITELQPDLIVLDVYMPGYSGLEVCQKLKDAAQSAHIPVILTVGKLEPFKPEEARRVKADAHIVKPFEASELLKVITRLEEHLAPRENAIAASPKSDAHGSDGGGRKAHPSAGDETGWKSRLGFGSTKKKEETHEAASGSFRDFRKTKDEAKHSTQAAETAPAAVSPAAEEAPHGVPDIPRDITPEELDALSALVAKLNTAPAEPQAAPPDDGPTHAAAAATTSDATATTSGAEGMAYDSTMFAPRVHAEESVAPVAPAEAVAPTQEFRVEGSSDAHSPAEHVAHTAEIATHDAAAHAAAVESNSQGVMDSHVPETQEYEHADAPTVSVTATVNVGPLAQEPAPVDLNDEPFFAVSAREGRQLPEDSAPSDADLAQALRLLTPSNWQTSNIETQGAPEAAARAAVEARNDTAATAGGETAGNAAGVSRWVAEPVPLKSEEASISLEEEMFRTLTGKPAAMSAVAGVGAAESAGISGFSAITAAVEQRLAANALTNTVESTNSSEAASLDAEKVNGHGIAEAASTATTAEAGAHGPDAGTIASIVDSVLADLRPKLMEEISRKLSGK